MAGKHYTSAFFTMNRRRTPLFYFFIFSLFFLCILCYVFTPSSSRAVLKAMVAVPDPDVEYSFVSSLEKFLADSKSKPPVPEDTVRGEVAGQDVKVLDDLITHREEQGNLGDGNGFFSPIRVYVYNMPSKFTYDLLWLFHNTYKETSNLTSNGSPVHRLIEQHSIDYWLWADLMTPESERSLKNVVRVYKQEEADLFYIPFFTTIAYFLLEQQQCKPLYRVKL